MKSERLIHEERSTFRTLMVFEQGRRRSLRFEKNGGCQSAIDLQAPRLLTLAYTRWVLASVCLVPQVRRILVIGLGGGVLPQALHQLCPSWDIDAVDIDPAVLRVAQAYFGYRPNARSRAHVADGRSFVRSAPAGVYDLVVLDAFGKDYIPDHLLTCEFLYELRERLAPGGLVVANTFTQSAWCREELATYRHAFETVHSADVPGGNRIVWASSQAPTRAALLESVAEWDERLRRFGVHAGWVAPRRNHETDPCDAPVLSDRAPHVFAWRRPFAPVRSSF